MPAVSVLINNYNYGPMLGDAIRSVLDQSFSDFELIIVDDGSTDNSAEVINSFKDPRIQAVCKSNGGQLSAFNAGIAECTGEIIAFLDSDDRFAPDYLEKICKFFQKTPDCTFLCTAIELFGNVTGHIPLYDREFYFGTHPFTAALLHKWIGRGTSAISMRKDLAMKILPFPEVEAQWKIRADDILVIGSDIAGAEKYFLPDTHIFYRVHGKNNFYACTETPEQSAGQKEKLDIFCNLCRKKLRLSFWTMLKRELHSPSFSKKILLRAALRLLHMDLKRKNIFSAMLHFFFLPCILLYPVKPLTVDLGESFNLQ